MYWLVFDVSNRFHSERVQLRRDLLNDEAVMRQYSCYASQNLDSFDRALARLEKVGGTYAVLEETEGGNQVVLMYDTPEGEVALRMWLSRKFRKFGVQKLTDSVYMGGKDLSKLLLKARDEIEDRGGVANIWVGDLITTS